MRGKFIYGMIMIKNKNDSNNNSNNSNNYNDNNIQWTKPTFS